jgi:cell wall-associated NlpC family hydrolase
VTQTLTALAERNESLAEKYNAAQMEVDADARRYEQAHAESQREFQRYSAVRTSLRTTVAALYRQRTMSTAAAMFTSDSGVSFLQTVDALESVSKAHKERLAVVDAAYQRFAAAEARAKTALTTATKRRDALNRQRQAVAIEQQKSLDLLDTLTAAERAQFFEGPASFSGNPLGLRPGATGSNPGGNLAVRAALSQLGKPYIWATAGPRTFDCSGLTLFAWAKAGVPLPHLASAQFRIGRHVEPRDLQPGDLVFFYPTIEHVGMYIGNGMMVHAPQTGDVVRIVPLNRFAKDFVGATRPNA